MRLTHSRMFRELTEADLAPPLPGWEEAAL